MKLGDLPDHGQPQAGPSVRLPGGIRLPEPLPDPFLVFRRNADAVIPHGQNQLPARPFQAHPDAAVLPPVFAGILE